MGTTFIDVEVMSSGWVADWDDGEGLCLDWGSEGGEMGGRGFCSSNGIVGRGWIAKRRDGGGWEEEVEEDAGVGVPSRRERDGGRASVVGGSVVL